MPNPAESSFSLSLSLFLEGCFFLILKTGRKELTIKENRELDWCLKKKGFFHLNEGKCTNGTRPVSWTPKPLKNFLNILILGFHFISKTEHMSQDLKFNFIQQTSSAQIKSTQLLLWKLTLLYFKCFNWAYRILTDKLKYTYLFYFLQVCARIYLPVGVVTG